MIHVSGEIWFIYLEILWKKNPTAATHLPDSHVGSLINTVPRVPMWDCGSLRHIMLQPLKGSQLGPFLCPKLKCNELSALDYTESGSLKCCCVHCSNLLCSQGCGGFVLVKGAEALPIYISGNQLRHCTKSDWGWKDPDSRMPSGTPVASSWLGEHVELRRCVRPRKAAASPRFQVKHLACLSWEALM